MTHERLLALLIAAILDGGATLTLDELRELYDAD